MSIEHSAYTRREFLNSGLVFASAALAVPSFLQRSAMAMARPLLGVSSVAGVPDDHILVVIQLSGGNDGLNTVVPYGMDAYHKARPGIGVSAKDALALSGADGIGLHPALAGLKEIYDEGALAVVQGVGYPNPNRSHFKSTDIWQTADISATGEGWLGRYFDSECCGFGKGESGKKDNSNEKSSTNSNPPGIAIGRTAPLSMQGRQITGVSFESPEMFRWSGESVDKGLAKAYEQSNLRGSEHTGGKETNADFLLRTALDAQVSSDLIRKAIASAPRVTYPNGQFASQLRMIGQMIAAGLKTRVYYATLGGFDTHAGQGGAQGRHANNLRQLGDALKAFQADLRQQGNAGRVLTMTFSEFGRRVSQNASGGTDHGTAAPMFLMGEMVRPGVHADHPSLTKLDEGDLIYGVDFRSVYAAILESWLVASSKDVLQGDFDPFPVIKRA